jgi:hypothetical protein
VVYLGVDNVTVELHNEETYSALIVKEENPYQWWYYYSHTENLAGATVIT